MKFNMIIYVQFDQKDTDVDHMDHKATHWLFETGSQGSYSSRPKLMKNNISFYFTKTKLD